MDLGTFPCVFATFYLPITWGDERGTGYSSSHLACACETMRRWLFHITSSLVPPPLWRRGGQGDRGRRELLGGPGRPGSHERSPGARCAPPSWPESPGSRWFQDS